MESWIYFLEMMYYFCLNSPPISFHLNKFISDFYFFFFVFWKFAIEHCSFCSSFFSCIEAIIDIHQIMTIVVCNETFLQNMVCHLQKHQEGRSEARFIASYVSKTTYWSNIPFVWNEWFCTCHSIGRDSWFNLQHFHRFHNLFLLAFILSFGRSRHNLQILWTSIRP